MSIPISIVVLPITSPTMPLPSFFLCFHYYFFLVFLTPQRLLKKSSSIRSEFLSIQFCLNFQCPLLDASLFVFLRILLTLTMLFNISPIALLFFCTPQRLLNKSISTIFESLSIYFCFYFPCPVLDASLFVFLQIFVTLICCSIFLLFFFA